MASRGRAIQADGHLAYEGPWWTFTRPWVILITHRSLTAAALTVAVVRMGPGLGILATAVAGGVAA